ncbi:hypothetical protein B0H13DRAFT_1871753 [Mycena leptocephala]|nr:hypothetical protein B0H13DRAFT_1871753 [Mycena leptocephala]
MRTAYLQFEDTSSRKGGVVRMKGLMNRNPRSEQIHKVLCMLDCTAQIRDQGMCAWLEDRSAAPGASMQIRYWPGTYSSTLRNQPKEAKNKSSVIQEHTCVTACAPEIDARDGQRGGSWRDIHSMEVDQSAYRDPVHGELVGGAMLRVIGAIGGQFDALAGLLEPGVVVGRGQEAGICGM